MDPRISQNLSYIADEAGLPGVHGGLAEPRGPVPKHVNYGRFWPRKQFSIIPDHFYTKFYRSTMNPPGAIFLDPRTMYWPGSGLPRLALRASPGDYIPL